MYRQHPTFLDVVMCVLVPPQEVLILLQCGNSVLRRTMPCTMKHMTGRPPNPEGGRSPKSRGITAMVLTLRENMRYSTSCLRRSCVRWCWFTIFCRRSHSPVREWSSVPSRCSLTSRSFTSCLQEEGGGREEGEEGGRKKEGRRREEGGRRERRREGEE